MMKIDLKHFLRNFGIFLTFLLLNSACIREIPFEIDATEKQLVVNAILSTNNNLIVNISALQAITDTANCIINNAIAIIKNDEFIDTLKYTRNGNYISTKTPLQGNIYSINVKVDGYPSVSAIDTIPTRTKIIEATKNTSEKLDDYGNNCLDYSISLKIDTISNQYYELLFLKQLFIESKDAYAISFRTILIDTNPIIAKYSPTFLFNNKEIHSSTYTIHITLEAAWETLTNYSQKPIINTEKNINDAVILRSVSKAYYDYRQSWNAYQYFVNDSSKTEEVIFLPLVGEPQDLYSNIENGLGIFVSFTQDYFIFNE